MQKIKYYLGKLVETQDIPGYGGGEIKLFRQITDAEIEYQVFENVLIGETVETNDDGAGGEYDYSRYRWVIIQEIMPIA
jgi:hypothetical protein